MTSQNSYCEVSDALKSYYHAVEKRLGGPRDRRQAILAQLRSDVAEFVAENPQAGAAEITAHFGTPAEYAEMAREDLPTTRRDGWFYLRLAAIVAAVLLVAWYLTTCILRIIIEKETDHTIIIGPAEYVDSMPEVSGEVPWEEQEPSEEEPNT